MLNNPLSFLHFAFAPNKRKHADSSQRFNKNYKDGLQLKIRSLRSSGSASQKKELILWGLNGKALACLLMMDEKFKSMKLKACGYKMRLVAFAPDRVCLLALEIGILFAFLMKTLISFFFFFLVLLEVSQLVYSCTWSEYRVGLF